MPENPSQKIALKKKKQNITPKNTKKSHVKNPENQDLEQCGTDYSLSVDL